MRVGIEIEAENVTDTPVLNNCRIEYDGSLRHAGIEIISDPIDTTDEAKEWYHTVITYLNSMGATYSDRTGVHIHMDFTDKRAPEVRHFLHKYLLVERYIISKLPEHRQNSNFCVPLLNYEGCSTVLQDYFQRDNTGILRDFSKYSALNLKPLYHLGTIEFRLLPTLSTTDLFEEVLNILEFIYDPDVTLNVVINKYDIPTADILEADAYMDALDITNDNLSNEDYLSHWFDVATPTQTTLTESLLNDYLNNL